MTKAIDAQWMEQQLYVADSALRRWALQRVADQVNKRMILPNRLFGVRINDYGEAI